VFTQLSVLQSQKTAGDRLPEGLLQEHRLYAEKMTLALEELGTCFIKLGQLLSTRADLLPPPYIAALSRLQHAIAPVPGRQIATIIEGDLCTSLSDLFSSFDFEPLATASIAQVHKASLPDGTPVVIKVQRPGVQQQVEVDIEVLQDIARFITRHTPPGTCCGLASIVQEMKLSLFQELDFLQEASNTQSVSHGIREFHRLVTPTIYPAYSSRQVLTLSYIPGRHLSQVSNEELNQCASTAIAKELLFAYLKQIIIYGVFHCDPHPGNLLLTENGRLALLDFGMIGRLESRQIENLVLLLLAFSERQGERVADIYLEMVDLPTRFDRRAFTQNICELVRYYHDRNKQGVEVGKALLELVMIANMHHISIPPNFALLGKALLNLDGTLRHLSPNLNLTQVIYRYLPHIIQRRMFTQISPGRSLAWVLDTKHLVENMLRKSDLLLGKLSDQSTTHEQAEAIRRASLHLSLGLVTSSLLLSLVLLFRTRRPCR
jgi:ubiquinone biosynthesis protein